MKTWFVQSSDELVGPLSCAQLKQMADTKQIGRATLVRLSTSERFVMAQSIGGLFAPAKPLPQTEELAGPSAPRTPTTAPTTKPIDWRAVAAVLARQSLHFLLITLPRWIAYVLRKTPGWTAVAWRRVCQEYQRPSVQRGVASLNAFARERVNPRVAVGLGAATLLLVVVVRSGVSLPSGGISIAEEPTGLAVLVDAGAIVPTVAEKQEQAKQLELQIVQQVNLPPLPVPKFPEVQALAKPLRTLPAAPGYPANDFPKQWYGLTAVGNDYVTINVRLQQDSQLKPPREMFHYSISGRDVDKFHSTQSQMHFLSGSLGLQGQAELHYAGPVPGTEQYAWKDGSCSLATYEVQGWWHPVLKTLMLSSTETKTVAPPLNRRHDMVHRLYLEMVSDTKAGKLSGQLDMPGEQTRRRGSYRLSGGYNAPILGFHSEVDRRVAIAAIQQAANQGKPLRDFYRSRHTAYAAGWAKATAQRLRTIQPHEESLKQVHLFKEMIPWALPHAEEAQQTALQQSLKPLLATHADAALGALSATPEGYWEYQELLSCVAAASAERHKQRLTKNQQGGLPAELVAWIRDFATEADSINLLSGLPERRQRIVGNYASIKETDTYRRSLAYIDARRERLLKAYLPVILARLESAESKRQVNYIAEYAFLTDNDRRTTVGKQLGVAIAAAEDRLIEEERLKFFARQERPWVTGEYHLEVNPPKVVPEPTAEAIRYAIYRELSHLPGVEWKHPSSVSYSPMGLNRFGMAATMRVSNLEKMMNGNGESAIPEGDGFRCYYRYKATINTPRMPTLAPKSSAVGKLLGGLNDPTKPQEIWIERSDVFVLNGSGWRSPAIRKRGLEGIAKTHQQLGEAVAAAGRGMSILPVPRGTKMQVQRIRRGNRVFLRYVEK